MPLFAASSQPGKALGRIGVGPPKFVEFIIVAGGGGAGRQGAPHYYERYKPWRTEFPGGCQPHYLSGAPGTGGGGGGYISSVIGERSGRNTSPVPVLEPTGGTNYPITIGAGGAGTGGTSNGNKGGNTSAFGYTAIGGGGGGYPCCVAGSNAGSGGCGGGGGGNFPHTDCAGCSGSGVCGGCGGGSGTANQGFPGACLGAGGSGSPATTYTHGGGTTSSITGSAVSYAKGGGGSNYGDGAPNSWGSGGRPGVVMCRYQGKDPEVSAGLSYRLTTVGAYQLLELLNGTGTIRW